MAQDPRTFSVKACPKTNNAQQATASDKKDFFGALGKVGDLEFLNDIGFGKIGHGLRVLSKTSNSIREGTVLASVMGAVETGANTVLDTVGIDSNTANNLLSKAGGVVDAMHPEVVNRAYGQAKAIYEKVKQGNFDLDDIPEVFSDLQNLDILIGGIFTGPQVPEEREFEHCGASPYATDLISWAPKYKFLFVVQFEFTEPYASDFADIYASFVVKNSSRPNITFDHEDVNLYNFWTKIPKRTIYEPMTMRFYDDTLNQAMSLYTAYLKVMSPISNLEFEQKMEDVSGLLEGVSMDFSGINQGHVNPGKVSTHKYASSLGPTNNANVKNLFKRITLFHVYKQGTLMNVYKFYNPKILSMELDDLDMADNGNGSEVSFQFGYDAVNIITGYPVANTKPYDLEALSGGSHGATYTMKNNSEMDTFIDGGGTSASDPRQPPGGEPPIDVGGIVGVVSTGINDAIGGAVDAVDGVINDVFDSNIVTDITGAVGDVIDSAGGVVGDTAIYAANTANVASGALDAGRQLLSNALDDASSFTGSLFL